ncbi:hypothetical protein F8M41_023380 [Gigaspora margarita]|uniref:Uncharacterized protein n=1 Tax=Gigaspora margarita TaxID=4874 RepID=A0A8H4ADG2_GIGMA|nr:hypothetical protein F8M41_023380 [Gigaspora margarita]
MHALFIRCRNLDDAKANGIIKKFLKFLVPEMGEQIFEDAASKLRSNFIEWRHTLWNRISKLFVELQKRAKSNDDLNKLFAKVTANDVQRVWQQFLVNIDIPAIRNEHNDSNKFENLLLDMVCVGVWALNVYEQKNVQTVFFNLNNDLYTVNLNVLTLNGWYVATSIDLSKYHFNAQKGAAIV